MNLVYVFQCSHKSLKKNLPFSFKRGSQVYFLLGGAPSGDIYSLAKKNGWEPVDISKRKNWSQERIIEEYLDLIASFSQWNAGTLHWWATHFSSKNRINSPVLPYLQELHQSLSAIENL